jgi:hypothetical protein
MRYRFSVLIVSWIVAAMSFQPLRAQEHCRLQAPALSINQIRLKITCQNGANDQTVPYPAGPLYVGVSLYHLENSALAKSVAPLTNYDENATLHLMPQEISRPTQSTELTFQRPPNVTQTHILVVVWDQKNSCDQNNDGCPIGFTLGKVDADELPIPVDAWPKPICDVAKLGRSGFFKWSETGELGGRDVPDQYQTMYLTNDCWKYDASWPGRRVSFRRWRVAPLSPP